MKRSWSRFCSVHCRVAFHRRPEGEAAPDGRAASCESCGVQFTTRRTAKRFCSDRCRLHFHETANPRLSRLKTTSEMAALLGVSTTTVRSRIRSGELTAHRVGGILLVVAPETDERPTSPCISPETASAFRDFSERYTLSFRELGKVLGFSGTSAFRLLNGKLTLNGFRRSRMKMMRGVFSYLSSIDAADAESEIERLFKDH